MRTAIRGLILGSVCLIACSSNATETAVEPGGTAASETSEPSTVDEVGASVNGVLTTTTSTSTTSEEAEIECVTVRADDRTVTAGDFEVITIAGMVEQFEMQQAAVLRFQPHDQAIIESGAPLTVTVTHFGVEPPYERTDTYADGVSFDGRLAYFVAPLYLAAGRWRFDARTTGAVGCLEVDIPFRAP